jgi:serine/threonine protein kinase
MFCSRCGTGIPPATQFCPSCGLDLRTTLPIDSVDPSALSELDVIREALASDYELREELGRGGMAIVYRALDLHLQREVALKVLPFSLAFDSEFVERFSREARTSGSLEHPHIIPVYRVGRSGRVIFFVMKLLRGGALSKVLEERRRLDPAEIRKLLADVASALGYAHARGIVHRDIKPDNIMFDEFGQCVVTDFGIAKAGTNSRLTGTGMSIGTPHYMSPEQARAQAIDGRSDLYSLGIVAYQALVGELPYDGEDSFSIGYKHIMEPIPVPLLDTMEERRLFQIVKKLMMKDPEDRYQDADALLRDLEGQPREGIAYQRRVTAEQAIIARQSTTPIPAQSVPLEPPPEAPPVRTPLPRPSVPTTPRRSVMRRPVVAAEPERGKWVPWAFAFILISGVAGAGYYLYVSGLLGGTHQVEAPAPDLAGAGPAIDSIMAAVEGDSAAPAGTPVATEPRPVSTLAAPVTPAVPPRPSGDSGTLLLRDLPPRSQIMIDSRPLTEGGAAVHLPAGWHELAITAPGAPFFLDSIYIQPQDTLEFSPALRRAGALSEARMRRLLRLDCDNPGPVNRYGRACYDSPPLPIGTTRVPVPPEVRGPPSVVILLVKVSMGGTTLAVRTRTASSEPAFTRAAEAFAMRMEWSPARRDGEMVEGWTQVTFVPEGH